MEKLKNDCGKMLSTALGESMQANWEAVSTGSLYFSLQEVGMHYRTGSGASRRCKIRPKQIDRPVKMSVAGSL
jgi:hypothetical protein